MELEPRISSCPLEDGVSGIERSPRTFTFRYMVWDEGTAEHRTLNSKKGKSLWRRVPVLLPVSLSVENTFVQGPTLTGHTSWCTRPLDLCLGTTTDQGSPGASYSKRPKNFICVFGGREGSFQPKE